MEDYYEVSQCVKVKVTAAFFIYGFCSENQGVEGGAQQGGLEKDGGPAGHFE